MTVSQSGSIDGIPYASSKYVYDTQGDGVVTDILFYDQAGHQVADQNLFTFPWFGTGPKTVNADGSFSLKIIPPSGPDGGDQGYQVETFSSSGLYQREDFYSPVYKDPSNPNSGVTGYTDSGYNLTKFLLGSSSTINGAYYDAVVTEYSGGRVLATVYMNALNGNNTPVATIYDPDPTLNVPPADTATAGTVKALNYISVADPWAANHPGTLALAINVDAGSVSGTDSTGHAFRATPGSAVHLTGTLAQINKDLSGLSFLDQTDGTAHVTFTVYDQAGISDTQRETITVTTPPPPNPVISGPTSYAIAADSQIHTLAGLSFSDPWAAAHAGSLALNVFTTLGTVSAGIQNGTSLHLTGTYSEIANDITYLGLASDHAGSGTVRIEVYDQAGLEAVHLIGVTAQASA